MNATAARVTRLIRKHTRLLTRRAAHCVSTTRWPTPSPSDLRVLTAPIPPCAAWRHNRWAKRSMEFKVSPCSLPPRLAATTRDTLSDEPMET